MRALIVGAGIGGLTTALSLHAAGIEARVLDAAPVLLPLGVGINLLPHAVRELIELGLGDALARSGIATRDMLNLDRFGNLVWSEPRGLAAGYRWPQYSIHRGELHTLLLDAVRARLGADAVRAGTVFQALRQDPDAVHSTLLDCSAGTESVESSDILIGADGLHSAVRAHLHPGEGRPLWNGVRMWRGVTETRPFLGGRTMIVAGSNRTEKFVAYPISARAARRGAARVNWVAQVRTRDTREQQPDWNRAGRLEEVLPHFQGWRFDGIEVCDLMAGSPHILEYPMVDRDPLDFWGTGRVTLLGDAAHPMYPVGSNGASQAVIDARVLAVALAAARGDAPRGLAAYEAARRERTNALVRAHRAIPVDRVLHLVAERAPDGFAAIEDVLRPAELAELGAAHRATVGVDAPALNSRASLTPRLMTGP